MRAGRTTGVLSLHGHEVGSFTDDLVTAAGVAENISYALTNMQHDEERAATQVALVEGEARFVSSRPIRAHSERANPAAAR